MQSKTVIATVSAATDVTGGPIDIGDMTNFSFYALFSGSDVVGTFKLQVGNDGSNFVDLSGSSSAVSASSDACLSVSAAGYRYVRFDWDYTSGTGNITVSFCGKGTLPKTNNRLGR